MDPKRLARLRAIFASMGKLKSGGKRIAGKGKMYMGQARNQVSDEMKTLGRMTHDVKNHLSRQPWVQKSPLTRDFAEKNFLKHQMPPMASKRHPFDHAGGISDAVGNMTGREPKREMFHVPKNLVDQTGKPKKTTREVLHEMIKQAREKLDKVKGIKAFTAGAAAGGAAGYGVARSRARDNRGRIKY